MTRRRRGLSLAALILFAGAAASAQPQAAADEVKAMEEAADLLRADMPPEERKRMDEMVEVHIAEQVEALSIRCGTQIRFTNETRFGDRSLLIDSAATPEQVSCVQSKYPFASLAPNDPDTVN